TTSKKASKAPGQTARTVSSRATAFASLTGDHHPFDQHRAGSHIAACFHVTAHRNDLTEHVAQVASDGHLLHRELDLAILDPVTTSTTRIIAGDQVQALAHQLSHQQATPHAADERRLILVTVTDEQV